MNKQISSYCTLIIIMNHTRLLAKYNVQRFGEEGTNEFGILYVQLMRENSTKDTSNTLVAYTNQVDRGFKEIGTCIK